LMWARVKGKTENDLLKLPFRDSYMFRPGYIQPFKGVRARSPIVNVMYRILTPLYYLLRPFKGAVTDSVSLGKAMINVAARGFSKKILENKDINEAALAAT
ncbi:MAG TPA: epimerase, partial [Chryseosolibacter sp.]